MVRTQGGESERPTGGLYRRASRVLAPDVEWRVGCPQVQRIQDSVELRMAADLNSLLLAVEGLDETGVESLGREEYERLYIQGEHRGEVALHNGGIAVFYRDRFHHAFRTSADRARRQFAKDKVAVERVARMRWIGEILRGRIPGTECWHVRPLSGRNHPLDRLYVLWEAAYVVWLWPTRIENAWRLSSAYPAPKQEITGYIRGG